MRALEEFVKLDGFPWAEFSCGDRGWVSVQGEECEIVSWKRAEEGGYAPFSAALILIIESEIPLAQTGMRFEGATGDCRRTYIVCGDILEVERRRLLLQVQQWTRAEPPSNRPSSPA